MFYKYFQSCFYPSNGTNTRISDVELRLSNLEKKLKGEIKEENEIQEINRKLDEIKTQLNSYNVKTDNELQTTAIRIACLTEEVKMASNFFLKKFDYNR